MEKQQDEFLFSLCRQAVLEKVCSGASSFVAFRKKSRWKKLIAACGQTQNGREDQKLDGDTLFDLASLTKPLCTALCVAALVSKRKLDLSTPLASLLRCRDYPVHWQQIRISDLLSHSSGLPAYREYFRQFAPLQRADNQERLFSLIAREALEYECRTSCVYSDLGYMALGRIVERVAEDSLADFFRATIAGPIGLEEGLAFRPVGAVPAQTRENIAATEHCPWRGRLLVGEVHDEHAWLLGGTAGHAGLFGKARAVGELCILLADIWHDRQRHPYMDSEVLRRFLDYTSPAGPWALGFDRPSAAHSSSGDCFSQTTVGHLGFTGTSFWIDLQQDKVVVLLTNRVHPSRENNKIRQFRPWFHNCIMREISMG